MLRVCTLLVLVGLFMPLGASAQITVFPECNFIGPAVNLPPGDYTSAQLQQMGVANNSIASIIVSNGYGVQLYTEDRFKGRSGKLLEMNQCLENTRYYKAVSSLSVFAVDQNGNPANPFQGAGNSPVSQPEPLGVELYTECGYGGRVVSLAAGRYTSSQLAQAGLPDNSISAIRVPQGMEIELFENDFYRGRSGSLGADTDCLVKRFNDQVSSVVVSGTPSMAQGGAGQATSGQNAAPSAVLVYDNCDYRGNGARLPVGEYLAKDLTALGIADNSIASIQVPAGLQALIFENDFMRGKSTRVVKHTRCLNNTEFAQLISSVSVVRAKGTTPAPAGGPAVANGRVTIFTDCSYGGRYAELPEGEYSSRDLNRLGFSDNTISAIKVAPGMSVTVFENDLFRGGSFKLDQDESCLINRRADDAISSLIVASADAEQAPNNVLTEAEREQLDQALNCVQPYVEKNLCNAESWNVIRNFCSLDKVPLMDDGYLAGHVQAGNCTVQNWPVLVQRISEPNLR